MVTWQQIGQGEPNPFDVTYTTNSTYSASYGEFVITEGDQVDLPSPSANAAVAVRSFGQRVTITTPSGNIRDSSTTGEVYFNSPRYVILVSDGTNWYVQNNESGIGPAIPDSVVSRTDDNGTSTGITTKRGLQVEANGSFTSVGARISNNTTGVTTAYLYDVTAATILDSTDISSLVAGDAFALTGDIVSGQKYNILVDADGGTFTNGFASGDSFPISGTDFDILSGVRGTTNTSGIVSQGINDIGNPSNVLG